MTWHRRPPKKTDQPKEFLPLEGVPASFPRETADFLKQLSKERGLPVARLVAYAVDKERTRDDAFEFNIQLPETEFKEYAYAEAAGKIMDFLHKFSYGTGVDTLALCRRDIGIESLETFLYAYRELLSTELIEEYEPSKNEKYYTAENYLRVRVTARKQSKSDLKNLKDVGL